MQAGLQVHVVLGKQHPVYYSSILSYYQATCTPDEP